MASARNTEGLSDKLEVNSIFTSLFHIIEESITQSDKTTHLLVIYRVIPSGNMFRPSGITIAIFRDY